MADISQIKDLSGTSYTIKDSTARSGLANKQDTLVSGTNIKTVNGTSLLGSGNIVAGGGDVTHDSDISAGSAIYTVSADQIHGYDINALIDLFYPIGSIYSSTVSTSPALLFGRGTWVQITDTFLLAAGSTYSAGSTGGEASHTLTVDEIPSHTHKTGIQGDRAGDYVSGGSSAYVYFAQGSGVNTTSTGGGQAHNNMPPYLVVYVWKRTA